MRNLRPGPGILITAAFIGPGTVATATKVGASFGYTLLWALAFSIIATIVLQEMAARLGLVSQQGLGEAIRKQFSSGLGRFIAIFLVISAILIGNAAYEAGNIGGAVLGLEALFPQLKSSIGGFEVHWSSLIIGAIVFILLESGSYKILVNSLVILVLLMSIVFITTALLLKPDFSQIFKGLLIPKIPEGALLNVIALIGTTVVPYNLFLHASTAKEKWKDSTSLPEAKKDTILSVLLGGFITLAIIITASIAMYGNATDFNNVSQLASQLEPLLGTWSTVFLSLGLIAAGVSSAMTAPVAAAYASSGILGWDKGWSNPKFKWILRLILIIGVVFSALGFKPFGVIIFAQAANGLLLPLITVFLLIVMNNRSIMGNNTNHLFSNILGVFVTLLMLLLGIKSLYSVWQSIVL